LLSHRLGAGKDDRIRDRLVPSAEASAIAKSQAVATTGADAVEAQLG